MMEKIFRSYDGGDSDYSITQLLSPPRMLQLKQRHSLKQDYVDLWAAFVGSLLHKTLEDHSPNGLKETRLYHMIENTLISGQVDYYDFATKTLYDYKTGGEVSLFSFEKDEWEQQQNSYAFLLRQKGLQVDQIKVLRFAVDWRSNSTASDVPSDIINIPMWSDLETLYFLTRRVLLHKEAQEASDKDLPLCTSAEMWERPSKWAVGKYGAKRALRLYDTEKEALAHIDGTDLCLQERPGQRVRCERFCACRDKCSQYEEYKNV